MAFLRVNGWTIPLTEDSVAEEHIVGGDFARAFSGNPISDEHFDKRVWSGQTPPVTEMVALAIQGAVRGFGHVWSCDSDLFSSKGLGVSGSTVGSRRVATAADGKAVVNSSNVAESKFGAGAATCEPAATNILSQNKRDGTEDGTTTGFTAVAGGAIASSTTQRAQGSRSLRVITANSGDGAETTTESASGATAYAGSCYVYTANDRSVKLELIDSVGSVVSTTFTARGGKWTRLAVTGTTAGGATNIRLRFLDNAAGGETFYLDMLQIEQGSFATTWANPTRAAGDLKYSASLISSAVDLTIAFWVRVPTASTADDRYIVNVPGKLRVFRPASNTQLRVETVDASGAVDTLDFDPSPWLGAWQFATIVLRANTETGESKKRILWNGVSSATSSPSGMPSWGDASEVQIGHQDGAKRLVATANEALIDDLMVVPYAAPDDQVLAWYSMGKAMSTLSRVYVDGDAMPDDALTVLAEGKAKVSKYVAAHKSSAFRSNLRVVDIELMEV